MLALFIILFCIYFYHIVTLTFQSYLSASSLSILQYFIIDSHGLLDKGAGLVIKFWVRIPQRLLVVLGRASNLKMLLCYVRTPCCVASVARGPFRYSKKENYQKGSSPGNKAKVKSVSEFLS